MTGKERRLKRLLVCEHRRCVLIPFDHGAWLGPVRGIDRPREITRKVLAGGANALLVSPGFLQCVHDLVDPETALVLRVSLSAGLSSEAFQEIPAATATTAIRMDADAVAVSIFFGRSGEPQLIQWLGRLIEECCGLDIPVIAEMMPPPDRFYEPEAIAHAARIGMELGADLVKTNYCGNVEAFRQVVASTAVPILVAGGPSEGKDDNTLQVAQDAVRAGAAGVAFGRRVWQADDPETLVRDICGVVYETPSAN